jgi:hypothetical protein
MLFKCPGWPVFPWPSRDTKRAKGDPEQARQWEVNLGQHGVSENKWRNLIQALPWPLALRPEYR